MGKQYKLFADQERSFISVQNLSQCIWELVESNFKGVLHIGGSESANRVTFAEKLAERVGLDSKLLVPSTTESAAPEIPYPLKNTFNVELASEVLQTPLLNLDEGLALEYPS
jgi:dTDP-4-dehydrorhamnose reductase